MTRIARECVGLVLAAGAGRRFGGPKQLARVGGRPLIEHAVAAVSELDRTVVVLGARAPEIRAGSDLDGAEIVLCDDWSEGMGASLRTGLATVAESADEVVVVLADQPYIGSDVVRRVRSASGDGVRAVFAGQPGHPVVLRRPLIAHSQELSGDQGFRSVAMTEVECSDLADPLDIDFQTDLPNPPDPVEEQR